MAQYRIAWLPGDGIGLEVLEALEVASKRHGEFPTAATGHLKIGLERIRAGASGIDGFQHFIPGR
jgi:isocitrate/isopropylmalate dehydrogenase